MSESGEAIKLLLQEMSYIKRRQKVKNMPAWITARAIRQSMTSVLLSLTICTCSVKILKRSTAAGVYSLPSSVFLGGCTLSASRIFMYHFCSKHIKHIYVKNLPQLKFASFQFKQRSHGLMTTFIVSCIRSTYAFISGSIEPLSEQT